MTNANGLPVPATKGRLAENIVHFTRALRKAGVRVGPAQVEDAVRAVQAAGFTRKIDFFHTLRATLITRSEHLVVFEQVFAMFWRDPEYLERMIEMMSPALRRDEEKKKKKTAERRAAEALTNSANLPQNLPEKEDIDIEARLNWSAQKVDRQKDFEQMSTAEITEAKRAIARMDLRVPQLATRRTQLRYRGAQIDTGATLRRALRRGGEIGALSYKAQKTRPPDLVALCDISGSMTAYSRMMLHFLHALALNPGIGWGRVQAFTFGTGLTNVTRPLMRKDPDQALEAVGRAARDWEGGTLIAQALERFNKDWSRRVLARGAVVLLITDGLERGDSEALSRQAERLSLSARRLIWLNPLLRWDGFSPLAGGVRALMPHVSEFRPCHSLASLEELAAVLSAPQPPDTKSLALA
ncbi:MAG: VWA domain-containing protein [Pseudomonadota bacterium]